MPPSFFTDSIVSVAPFTPVPRSSPSRQGSPQASPFQCAPERCEREAREREAAVGGVRQEEVQPRHESELEVGLVELERDALARGHAPRGRSSARTSPSAAAGTRTPRSAPRPKTPTSAPCSKYPESGTVATSVRCSFMGATAGP